MFETIKQNQEVKSPSTDEDGVRILSDSLLQFIPVYLKLQIPPSAGGFDINVLLS